MQHAEIAIPHTLPLIWNSPNYPASTLLCQSTFLATSVFTQTVATTCRMPTQPWPCRHLALLHPVKRCHCYFPLTTPLLLLIHSTSICSSTFPLGNQATSNWSGPNSTFHSFQTNTPTLKICIWKVCSWYTKLVPSHFVIFHKQILKGCRAEPQIIKTRWLDYRPYNFRLQEWDGDYTLEWFLSLNCIQVVK